MWLANGAQFYTGRRWITLRLVRALPSLTLTMDGAAGVWWNMS